MRNTPAKRKWVTTERAYGARRALLVTAMVVGFFLWKVLPFIERHGGTMDRKVFFSLMFAFSTAGVCLIVGTVSDLSSRLIGCEWITGRAHITGQPLEEDPEQAIIIGSAVYRRELSLEERLTIGAAVYRLIVVLRSLGIGVFIAALSPEVARTGPLRDQILNLIYWLSFIAWNMFSIVSAYLIWVTILDAFDARPDPSD